MKDVKIFLSKATILLLLLIVVDVMLGLVFRGLFYKQTSGKYFTTTHAIDHAKEDIAIFGNSHAAQHYNALLMQKTLKTTAFNFGNQGQGFLYTYILVKASLAHHTPKLIIINVDNDELKYNAEDRERLSIFLPYHGEEKIIDSAIAMSGKFEAIKANSVLYRYNSLLGYMLLNTYKPSYNKSMESLGFDPIDGTMEKAASKVSPKPEPTRLDTAKIESMISLVSYIKAKHIKVLFATTPVYHYQPTGNDLYKSKLEQLLMQLQVNYLDASSDNNFIFNANLFHDESHLNTTGANLWTMKCADYIQNKDLLN